MKAIKPLLLSLSMLALACGTAQANDAKGKSDAQAKPSTSQSGSASSGASGSASSGGTGSTAGSARPDFDKADKNKDGQLSRTEFNDMLKGSASAGGSTAAGGSTSGAGQSSAGQPGPSSAKTQTPSSGKMDDKAKTSK
jgi:hypothetical protein